MIIKGIRFCQVNLSSLSLMEEFEKTLICRQLGKAGFDKRVKRLDSRTCPDAIQGPPKWPAVVWNDFFIRLLGTYFILFPQ